MEDPGTEITAVLDEVRRRAAEARRAREEQGPVVSESVPTALARLEEAVDPLAVEFRTDRHRAARHPAQAAAAPPPDTHPGAAGRLQCRQRVPPPDACRGSRTRDRTAARGGASARARSRCAPPGARARSVRAARTVGAVTRARRR